VRLHVGDSNHEAIGTVLVSIRVDSVKNRGGSLTMQNDTVAESACRSLGGVEPSTTAEGKYEARWSVKGQRDSGQAGGGRDSPLSLAAPRPSCRHKVDAQESGRLDPTRLISDSQLGTRIREILPLPIATSLPACHRVVRWRFHWNLPCGQPRQCVDSIESGLPFGMERPDRPWYWL
jgi:hypothetical protein